MKKELTTQHLKNLKELLKAKKIKPYDLAHASFRKNNAHAIISKVDKYERIIEYLDGAVYKYASDEEGLKQFKNRIEDTNKWYYISKRKYINRYFQVVKKWIKHRKEMSVRMRKKKNNSLKDRLSPENVEKLLKSLKH